MLNTSWEKSGKWYKKIVGGDGHYYHQKVIFPNVLRLLNLKNEEAILDLACGEGVLERKIPKNLEYVGIDLSTSLINEAKRKSQNEQHQFLVADVGRKLPINKINFDFVTIILALQNIKNPSEVIRNAKNYLKKNGKFLIVLNHPIFRIPRQSSWGIDKEKKIQYRRIDNYMSHLKIPIWTHPGQGQKSENTWSFHYPLSAYSEMLFNSGFVIEKIEEWVSDKTSTGGAAGIENRARKEFPLFMAIVARKV